MRAFKSVLLFIIVSLTWGTTWLSMRIAVETIPPLFATGMRFAFASPFLFCFAWLTKTPLIFPPGQRIFQIGIVVFYFSIPFTLMIYGEQYVSSALASIIFSFMPVAVLITSLFILNEKVGILQITGLAVATGALISILLGESSLSASGGQWLGMIALVLAVIIHAVMYSLCKKRSCTVSVITFNALPCSLAGILLLILGWLFERPDITLFSSGSVLATLYLGGGAGVFGILSYFALQKCTSAFKSSLVFLVFPVVAIALDKIVYGYAISTYTAPLLIPLACGIFIVLAGGGKKQKETTPSLSCRERIR